MIEWRLDDLEALLGPPQQWGVTKGVIGNRQRNLKHNPCKRELPTFLKNLLLLKKTLIKLRKISSLLKRSCRDLDKSLQFDCLNEPTIIAVHGDESKAER
jgi:hypothetical protein